MESDDYVKGGLCSMVTAKSISCQDLKSYVRDLRVTPGQVNKGNETKLRKWLDDDPLERSCKSGRFIKRRFTSLRHPGKVSQ
jgi:hypothetical protein